MDRSSRLSPEDVSAARIRRIEAMTLQDIEGNPLSPDQVSMFAMFEQKRWSHERRREYIMARIQRLAAE
jgi:hypothetical protein